MGKNLETLGMMGEDVVKGLFEYSKYMLIYPAQFRRSVKSRGMGKMIFNYFFSWFNNKHRQRIV